MQLCDTNVCTCMPTRAGETVSVAESVGLDENQLAQSKVTHVFLPACGMYSAVYAFARASSTCVERSQKLLTTMLLYSCNLTLYASRT